MPELDRDTAREWIERWDRQQEESLPDREDRFTALIDAVEEGTGRPDPLVLDIGCGPGSLGVRLLARLPRATVIGIDADPVSLTLGRAAYSGRARAALPRPGPARSRLGGAAGPGDQGAGRRGEHHGAALAARARAARHVRRARLRAPPRRPAARRRPFHPGRQGIPGPGPPGPGAAPARGPATLPRRAFRELARLVGRRGRRPGAGRPRGRTRPPPGRGRSSCVGVDRCSPPTSRPSGRPASPRSARSGSAATTASCAASCPRTRTATA